ncbi:sporulation histidine kinase inhibitor Sda [Cytobacillus sp. FJAT-54145]|uniref:Sporulation histidine kinase inhibitor Sda n=1 Tax=Cytobacillus spartinae TaxID=3299023 RepID=A0ABW6KHX8_9BACI
MKISDKELIEAYYSSLQLALDHDFIHMLKVELDKRNIKLDQKKIQKN